MTQINSCPQGWQELPLKNIADIVRGQLADQDKRINKNEARYSKEFIPYIESKHIRNHKEVEYEECVAWKTLPRAGEIAKAPFSVERILLTSARLGTAGRVGIMKAQALHSDAVNAIIPKIPMQIEYLFYYLQYRSSWITSGITSGKTRIAKGHLEELPVYLPPGDLQEQARIVRRLEARLREAEQSRLLLIHMQTEVLQLFRQALQEVFAPEQVIAWSHRPSLGTLVEVIRTVPLQTLQEQNYPYIAPNNIHADIGTITRLNTWQHSQQKLGILLDQARQVVLLASKGVSKRQATLIEIDQVICSPSLIPLHVKVDNLMPEFLLWSLLSDPFVKFATTNPHSGSISTISANKVLAYEFPLPDIHTQRRIITHLQQVKKSCEAMLSQLELGQEAITEINKAFFQQAFQGDY